VISLTVLRHVPATAEHRAAYLKMAAQKRRDDGDANGEANGAKPDDAEEAAEEVTLSPERFAELEAAEEFILTVTEKGFGKRTSAYEYRLTGRGGQGIIGIGFDEAGWRTGREVVATMAVRPGDDVMLVTDGGMLIRTGSDQVRVTGRGAMGVRLLRLEEGERVTSCFTVLDGTGEADEGDDG
jgi:DNA gyrase subunit A